MKTPDPTKAKSSVPNKRCFNGTANARKWRGLAVLLRRPISRKKLDIVTGCLNGPQLVSDLQDLGLGKQHLPCDCIDIIERDGKICRAGAYYLTEEGRRVVKAWTARRDKDCIRKNFSNQELDGFNGPQ